MIRELSAYMGHSPDRNTPRETERELSLMLKAWLVNDTLPYLKLQTKCLELVTISTVIPTYQYVSVYHDITPTYHCRAGH